jgi:hypothetical protein
MSPDDGAILTAVDDPLNRWLEGGVSRRLNPTDRRQAGGHRDNTTGTPRSS